MFRGRSPGAPRLAPFVPESSSGPRPALRRRLEAILDPGRELVHGRDARGRWRRVVAIRIEQHEVDAGPAGPDLVHRSDVAHVERTPGHHAHAIERDPEDPRVGLLDPDLVRIDDEL